MANPVKIQQINPTTKEWRRKKNVNKYTIKRWRCSLCRHSHRDYVHFPIFISNWITGIPYKAPDHIYPALRCIFILLYLHTTAIRLHSAKKQKGVQITNTHHYSIPLKFTRTLRLSLAILQCRQNLCISFEVLRTLFIAHYLQLLGCAHRTVNEQSYVQNECDFSFAKLSQNLFLGHFDSVGVYELFPTNIQPTFATVFILQPLPVIVFAMVWFGFDWSHFHTWCLP